MSRLRGFRDARRVRAQRFGFLDGEKGQFGEAFSIPGEVAQVIPAHGVDIGLCDFVRQLAVVASEDGKETLGFEKTLLLNDLSVYVR